ncbi:MAG: carboxypeptidase-like regulatory domain-containing protein [Firmicutes bacterium]|nr:carboxypeptidase-like regulatory domain-containing protein [Bacillota bacterium]
MRMRKRLLGVVSLVILTAVMSGCLFGPKVSDVTGKVTWEDGTGISGATVVLAGVSAETNENGEFALTGVKRGTHTLVVLIDGVKAQEKTVTLMQKTETVNVQVLPKLLRLDAPANVYAYLMQPFPAVQGDNIILEARLKVESNPGASWAPGIFLYWGLLDYAGVGQGNDGKIVLAHRKHGLSGQFDKTADGVVLGQWIELQIELADRVYVRARPDGSDQWVQVGQVLRKDPMTTAPSYIMVGKGYEGDEEAEPFLRNSYTGTGPDGAAVFSDVRLYVDGELVLHEDFIHLGNWEIFYDTAAAERIDFTLVPR